MQHAFELLNVKQDALPVFFSYPAMAPLAQLEKSAQILFETFQVPSAYLGLQPQLALFNARVFTGISVDVGDGLIQTVAVRNGSSSFVMCCLLHRTGNTAFNKSKLPWRTRCH